MAAETGLPWTRDVFLVLRRGLIMVSSLAGCTGSTKALLAGVEYVLLEAALIRKETDLFALLETLLSCFVALATPVSSSESTT